MVTTREARVRCPNCERTGAEPFYGVKNVPVHSCVLLDAQSEAAEFPTGDIELAFCQHCGFMFNAVFDSSKVDYTQPYEDQQIFSPTFKQFSRALAQDLIQRYELDGKTILEIGCGKGDFLLDLCQDGRNLGIGIDPAVREDRIPERARSYIRCIREYFGPAHVSLRADFVCCRHTLEHVHETLDFMRNVRKLANGQQSGLGVFIEVPDTLRVLRERAFWDIYYEHCSYFTAGSISNLVRSTGFEVTEIQLAYGDQYLLVHGAALNEPSSDAHSRLQNEESKAMRSLVREFSASVREKIRQWRETMLQYQRDGKRVAIWGSGSKAVSFLTTLGFQHAAQAIVDINPYRHGKYIPLVAQEIVPPEELRRLRPEVVIVMNPIYRGEIEQQLSEMGLTPQVLTLE